jgi:2,4-dienoyl-CoA reductase-like NADH-dependent reductase (Old Yellow Enzyme family)
MKEENPIPGFSYLVTELAKRFPNLAYLHIVEPRADELAMDMPEDKRHDATKAMSNDFIREIWGNKTLISAGGYERDSAIKTAEEKGDVIGFSRHYIANVCYFMLFSDTENDTDYDCSSPQPDLPYRLFHNLQLFQYELSFLIREIAPPLFVCILLSKLWRRSASPSLVAIASFGAQDSRTPQHQ